jgi:Zn-dependent protease
MQHLNSIQLFAVWVLPVLFAITLHEAAHGWVASKLGDKTALMLGRVTLNPLKHIDPIGTILLPTILFFAGGFIFGWAKPVPVTWENLKNPRRDMAIVALAGPTANFLMALFWGLLGKIGLLIENSIPSAGFAFNLMGQAGILINLVLLVLNLIPIPPLDGSRLIASLLPRKAAYYYSRIEPFGLFILLILIFTNVLSYIMLPPIQLLYMGISRFFGLPIQAI